MNNEDMLIANFMECEFHDDGRVQFTTNVDDYVTENPMWDTSWDWLMPVVCRIDDLFGDDDYIDDQINKVHNAVLKFDREIVHRAVVEFIKSQKL